MIQIKRAYEKPIPSDGMRILVDRLWPRGVSKEKLKLHSWEKELAPSTDLRDWFGHDPKKWIEFKRRYRVELKPQRPVMNELKALAKKHTVTLIFGAKDEEHNNAVALKEFLK